MGARLEKTVIARENAEYGSLRFLEKGLTPETARILEAIFNLKPIIRASNVARITGKPLDYVKKKIYSLRARGLRVMGVVDYYRLGLIRYIAFTRYSSDDTYRYRDLMSFYVEVLSPITGAFYGIYMPLTFMSVYDYVVHELRPFYYFPAEITVYPKPDFDHYYNFASRKPVVDFTYLYSRFNTMVDETILPSHSIAKHIDLLDLLILREIESNALTTFKDIALRIKALTGRDVRVSKISRHYSNHILKQNLVKGTTLHLPPSNGCSILVMLMTRGDSEVNYALANAFSETFLHRVSFVSTSSRRSLHILSIPTDVLHGLVEFIRKINAWFDGIEVYVAGKQSIKYWGVPYHLFDREKRWWSLDKFT